MRRDEAAERRDDDEVQKPGAADDAADLPWREDVHALTVVGLGGSAGSIPALEAFFQGLPEGSGPAYVVVLHLAPDHESRLAELLARSTPLSVSQVMGTVRMERDHVYVIPPGKQMEMRDGTLSLRDLEAASGTRTAIDTFFRTLADAHGPQATAVVLSGVGADGTLGLRRIKEAGGLTVAQSPAEAEYDAMPRNAIATGQVDYVLPAAAMAGQIAAYWETSSRMRLPAEAAPSPEQRLEGPEPEAALRDILAHVRAQTGHDFGAYKRATVLRRIGRRLQINGQESLPAYLDFLRRHPAETGDLVGDLLISVTQFFRDPEAWQALERDTIPRLLPDRDSSAQGAQEPVRVWACGCATGEEAYSLAILLLERAARTGSPARLQVFATDMDADAIAAAREGVYPDTIVADVSEERIRRWFYRTEGGQYQVRKEVRETVLFASHDVLRDTPFSRMSLVICRNLLIYLNPEAQRRVFETFHFALRPEGRLFLGTSESAEAAPSLFGSSDKPHRLFVRRPVARPVLPVFTGSAGPPALAVPERLRPALPLEPPPPVPLPVTGAGELHRSLLELYAPPSALVDERHEVLHLSDGAGRFLRVAGGEPTRDLLRMIRPELRVELRTALFMAASEGRGQVRLARASLSEGRPPAPVRLTVRSVDAPEGARGYFLVFFQELASETAPAALTPAALTMEESVGVLSPPVVPDSSTAPVVRQLEEENAHLQTQVRATVERYEAINEELKASNEELQAINEELRSAAEELETSKEELQSVNEELTTVNHELKSRVDEVSRANGDLQNFLASTDIGTVFLDRALRIRRYTPAAETLFQLIPTDVGRPLSDLTTRLDYPDLGEDAARVLERLETSEREVATADGQRHFLARLLPYRTLDDRIDGVVVNFVDIADLYAAQEQVRESEARQSFLVKLSDAIRPLTDPADIQAGAARVLGEHLGADRAYHVEINEAGREFIVAREWRRSGAPSHARRYPQEDWPLPWLVNGETWVVRDTDSDLAMPDDQRASYRDNDIRAAIVVPLIKEGRLIATFVVNQNMPRAWTAVEIALVEETAERTWAALERARAEAALARSEEKYRTLFDSIDEGVTTVEVIFDDDGKALDYRYLEYNPLNEKLTGIEQPVGTTARESTPGVEDHWVELIGEVARTGEPVRTEYPVASLGKWFSAYFSRVGGANSRQVVCVYNDITERKHREAHLAFLAEINLDLAPLLTVHEVMDQIGGQLADHLQLSRCHFSIVDEEYDRIEVVYEYRRDGRLPSLMGVRRISEGITEEGGQHYRAGRLAVMDAAADSPLVKTPARLLGQIGFGSMIDVPHLEAGRWRFLLTLGRAEADEWRSDEVEMLQELASKIYIRIERARVEEALRKSEENYRMLFDSIDEGFCAIEVLYDEAGESVVDYRFLETNPAFMRQTGMENVVGKTMRGLAPEHEEFWFRTYGRIARTGEAVRFEHEAAALGRFYDVYAFRIGEPGENRVAAIFSDILARRQIEENLRESEERFRLFVTASSDTLYKMSADWSVIRSLEATDFLGGTESPSRNWPEEYIPDSDKAVVQATLAEAIREKKIFELEHRVVRADGTVGWTLSRAIPLLDRRGEIVEWFGTARDISDRKRAEESLRESEERARAEKALRESEERFRTLADAVPQVIWTNTADGVADYFNRRWYDYTGLTYEQSAGPGWQAVVHPDDAPASVERWQRALAAGAVFDTEYRLRGADGDYCWFIGRNVPLKDAAGTITAWFGSATDIEGWKQAQAAREESEERFRLLVEGARDYAMFLLDTGGRITFWSAGAERILGYTEAQALGQPSALIFTPEDRERSEPEREMGQARADGQAADRRWHLRRDGTRFWADGMLMRLDDDQGALRGFAKVMRDATEQWRAEEETRRAMEAVAQANAELERRVEERTARWREAAAARQDLTRRLVGAEEEERRRLSRELHDQTGQHLTGLMLGLDALRAAQTAGGEPGALAERLRQAAADLSREVHQLAWDLRPPALDDIGLSQTLFSYVQEWGQRQGVAADFFAPDWDGDRLAPEVETALYRVVQEALTNVARHARAARVSIVLERRDDGAVLVVEDDGAGFDVPATLASPARLGLRGMRERVEMVGGTLEIESSGGGTTLVVQVPPLAQETAAETTAAETTAAETTAAETLENADA